MKIKIERGKLHEALSGVKDAIGSGMIMVTQNVLIKTIGSDSVEFTGTDLDIAVTKKVKCEVIEGGETTVPAKFMLAATSAFGAPTVEFYTDDKNNKAVLVGGETHYRMKTINAEDFPVFSEITDGVSFDMEQRTLKDILRKVAYAASTDSTRNTLKGICLTCKSGKESFATATDGRRLSIVENCSFGDSDFSVILPDTSARYLARIVGTDGIVKVTIGKGNVEFRSDAWTMRTKLVDSNYPNVRQVIPDSVEHTITVDRSLFLSAIKQVSVSASVNNPQIMFNIRDNAIVVSANNNDIGSDARTSFPVKYDGEDVSIRLCPTYVTDVLSNLDDDEVLFGFNNERSPVVIENPELGFKAVVMPLRVN